MDAKAKRFWIGVMVFFGLGTAAGIGTFLGWIKDAATWVSKNQTAVSLFVAWELVLIGLVAIAYLSFASVTLYRGLGESVKKRREENRQRAISLRVWQELNGGIFLYRDWRMDANAHLIRYAIGLSPTTFDHRNPQLGSPTCSMDNPDCGNGTLQHTSDPKGGNSGYCCVRCQISYARSYPETINREALEVLKNRIAALVKEIENATP